MERGWKRRQLTKRLIGVLGLLALVWASVSLSKERVTAERGAMTRHPEASVFDHPTASSPPTVQLRNEFQEDEDPHHRAPSLECLTCHSPHPPNSAEDIEDPNFEIPPHRRGPQLDCSHCHTYDPELEEIDPNGCVGCHERGGYPILEALDTLTREVGHPFIAPFIREVPSDCLLCHQGNLGSRLHRRHFLKDTTFVRHFRTGCVRCHALTESGTFVVTSQPLP